MPGISYRISFLAILSLALGAFGSPINSTVADVIPRSMSKGSIYVPEYIHCNDYQIKQIKESMSDFFVLVDHARSVISNGGPWTHNKGYQNYFKPEDHEKVKDALTVLTEIGQSKRHQSKRHEVKWNFKCDDCRDCKFLVGTVSYPENSTAPGADPPIEKGIRTILLYPSFFENERTTRHLPGPADKKGINQYCECNKPNTLKSFQTGGDLLIQQITYLDSFGQAAGFREMTRPAKRDGNIPEFTAHGADAWENNDSATQARRLKTTDKKDKIERWQNGPSYRAMATEMYAGYICDLNDISL